MTFTNPIIGGHGTLVRQAMQSEGFQSGVTGWRITRAGDAEFNSGTFRGSVRIGPDDMPQVVISADASHGFIRLPTNRPIEDVAAELQALITNEGAADESLRAGLFSPRLTGDANGIAITLNSPAADASHTEFFAVSSSAQAGILFIDRTSLLIQGDLNVASGSSIKRGSIVAPTLETGWSDFGGGFAGAGYIELPDHTGMLVGVVSGTPPDTIFTLPAALRPSATQGPFICAATSGRTAQVVIETDGDVNVQNADVGTTWVSLAGCRWPIDGF